MTKYHNPPSKIEAYFGSGFICGHPLDSGLLSHVGFPTTVSSLLWDAQRILHSKQRTDDDLAAMLSRIPHEHLAPADNSQTSEIVRTKRHIASALKLNAIIDSIVGDVAVSPYEHEEYIAILIINRLWGLGSLYENYYGEEKGDRNELDLDFITAELIDISKLHSAMLLLSSDMKEAIDVIAGNTKQKLAKSGATRKNQAFNEVKKRILTDHHDDIRKRLEKHRGKQAVARHIFWKFLTEEREKVSKEYRKLRHNYSPEQINKDHFNKISFISTIADNWLKDFLRKA